MKVRNNFNPTKEEMAIRRAIHTLQDACEDQIILMQDEDVELYLVPSILGEGMDDTEIGGRSFPRPAGTIEYQVSDGLPGQRGTSFDFYRLSDAIACFKHIQQVGWKKATGKSIDASVQGSRKALGLI